MELSNDRKKPVSQLLGQVLQSIILIEFLSNTILWSSLGITLCRRINNWAENIIESLT